MERQKKEQLASQLAEILQSSQAIIVTDFNGMNMEQLVELRGKMRDAGCQFQVAKNTLIKLAAKDTPTAQLADVLVGNNALAYTTGDPAAMAKVLVDFAKTTDKLVIKAGVLGEKILNPAQIKALASLPSRDVMLATLLGTMNALPTNMVRVLAAVPQKLVYALAAIRDQKEAA